MQVCMHMSTMHTFIKNALPQRGIKAQRTCMHSCSHIEQGRGRIYGMLSLVRYTHLSLMSPELCPDCTSACRSSCKVASCETCRPTRSCTMLSCAVRRRIAAACTQAHTKYSRKMCHLWLSLLHPRVANKVQRGKHGLCLQWEQALTLNASLSSAQSGWPASIPSFSRSRVMSASKRRRYSGLPCIRR